ncbi:MAG: DUF6390 family protein [Candidatus Limnocylindrales bacterium]
MAELPFGPAAMAPARVSSEAGPLRFARFAYRPNDLGYCGGDEAASLFQHVVAGVVDPGLEMLCREFEGAYPYLQDLATSAGIADPLDSRVVEAYWVGSRLLEATRPPILKDDLARRFQGRTTRSEWAWLARKPEAGAVPHHSFHVLDIFPRVGLMRGGPPTEIVPTMERCLVRPARVVAVRDGELLVEARPLEYRAGRLGFGAPRPETVLRHVDGRGFVDDVQPGEDVAIHWGWACDRLAPSRRAALERAIGASLRLANQTL